MTEEQIIQRIKTLCESRSWTVYRLSKASGITYSTLCTMLNKGSAPSMATLAKICDGFGITIKQFFDPEDDSVTLTVAEKAHLLKWGRLSNKDRDVVDNYINFLLNQKKDYTETAVPQAQPFFVL